MKETDINKWTTLIIIIRSANCFNALSPAESSFIAVRINGYSHIHIAI